MKGLIGLILLLNVNLLMADEVLTFNAQYSIPTIDGEDQNLAQYDLKDYTVTKRDDGSATLNYKIPTEMTGLSDQEISMELMIESLPLRVFTGEKATALCRGVWSQMECDVRFTKLEFDIDELMHQMHMRGMPHEEIEARLSIIERFSGDPIGKSNIK